MPNGLQPPPPPSFLENNVANYYDRYGCTYARRYDGQLVWNACTLFPEIGTILRGGGGGHLPFGTFPKIHPIRQRDPSLRLLWPLQPSSKCVLFWFFSIQLLKKHTQNPEITILYQFHAQKVLFKAPKMYNIKFLDWKWPLPLFGTFLKIHPIWCNHTSLREAIL